MNIVFMGSAEFGIPVLERLSAAGHVIKGIVSVPRKQSGRGLKPVDSPVVAFARQKGLGPVLTPENLRSADFVEVLKKMEADVFIIVAFRIVPREVFSLPPFGAINIHASLLPRFRGPAPIQRAIAAGEKTTGISIFRIDEGMDTGMIMLQKEIAIGDEETAPQLNERLSRLGADGIEETLAALRDNSVVYSKQNPALATPAPKLTKAEGNIDWGLPARTIFNRIRAFKPFPGAYTFYEGLRLNIEGAVVIDGAGNDPPGTVYFAGRTGIDVQCGEGRLRIVQIKPEGKKTMSAPAFLAGRNIVAGARFGKGTP